MISIRINFRKFFNFTIRTNVLTYVILRTKILHSVIPSRIVESSFFLASILSFLTESTYRKWLLLFILTRTSRCWRCWRPLGDSLLSRCTLFHPWWRLIEVSSVNIQWIFNRHVTHKSHIYPRTCRNYIPALLAAKERKNTVKRPRQ